MIKSLFSAAVIAASALTVNAGTTVLWESADPEGVKIDWGTKIGDAVQTPDKCANYKVGDKILITVAHYDTTLDKWPQVRITSPADGWPVIFAAQVLNDKPEPAVIEFEIKDEDTLDWIKEDGYFPSGNACWLSKLEYVTEGDDPVTPPTGDGSTVLWESADPAGIKVGWGTYLGDAVQTPEKCANYQIGDKILITVAHYDTTLDKWPQVRISSPADGWPVIMPAQVLNDKPEPTVIEFEIKDEDTLDWIKEDGYLPVGNACWLSKMEYVPASTSEITGITFDTTPQIVNVYNLQGRLLKSGVSVENAKDGLAAGLYIIGNKKVLVK